MDAPRIIIINVYFGALPFWFPAFLLSCRSNPDVDWLIVTDSVAPAMCTPNVTFLTMSLDRFNRRCSEKLGYHVDIRPSYAYKICDLRPAFGRIFEDDIENYTFYGHSDLDVIWGSFKSFITADILKRFDIITSRIRRISGHFCLFRNNQEVVSIFKQIPGFKRMLQDKTYHYLDEEHLTRYLHARLWPSPLTRFKHAILRKPSGGLSVYWDSVLTTSGEQQRRVGMDGRPCLRWKDGRTFTTDGTEMMYLHFHKIRSSMTRIDFSYRDDPAAFRITREGFFAAPPAVVPGIGD